MYKYLLILLLGVGTLNAASGPGAVIVKNLSEYRGTNHLNTNDLIAVSTQPSTGYEQLRKMTYLDFRGQLHTNPVFYNRTNFFGPAHLRELSWYDDHGGDGQLVGSLDHSNMVIMVLRHNTEPQSEGAHFNHGIYFGSPADPFGSTPSASFFSMQVSGGLGYNLTDVYQGDARITFAFHSDEFTWRMRELSIESGGVVDGQPTRTVWEQSMYVGHNIISHNNIGDVWLADMGDRKISMVTPISMTNQEVFCVLDRYNTGLMTNGFKAIGGAYVFGGTNFTIGASAAATAANFTLCVSNIFNISGHGNRGIYMGAYVENGTNITIRALSGTRDISIAVGAGMSTAAGTNGTTTTSGPLIVRSSVTVTATTNQLTFGATNSAPSTPGTIVKWASVTVAGDTNAYRLPLYK